MYKLFSVEQNKKHSIQQLALGLYQLAKIFQQCRVVLNSSSNLMTSTVHFFLDRVYLLKKQDEVENMSLKFETLCLQNGFFLSSFNVQVSMY
jgi:hypothetical protein